MLAAKWLRGWAWLTLATALSGCAGQSVSLRPIAEDVELVRVPFVSQETDQCGPAALAMVLSDSSVTVDVEDLRKRVHIPDRKGSLQLELIAAVRQAQRIAYPLEARPNELIPHLLDGRPVIVLQNLGARWLPVWHYEVVVGYQSGSDTFVLRSGNTPRRLMGRREFLRRWSASDYWGLVVVKPDEVPVPAQAMAYLQAVSAHESLGQWAVARAAFSEAVGRWPNNAYAHLGLGNVEFNSGANEAAIESLEEVLRLDSRNLPALNNLAYAYADAGNAPRALAMADRGLAQSIEDESVRRDLQSLRASLAACHGCRSRTKPL